MELKQAEWYVHTRRFWLAQFESLLEREKKSSHIQHNISRQSKEHTTGNK